MSEITSSTLPLWFERAAVLSQFRVSKPGCDVFRADRGSWVLCEPPALSFALDLFGVFGKRVSTGVCCRAEMCIAMTRKVGLRSPERQISPLAELPPHVTLNNVYGWEPCTSAERWSGLTKRLCELRETPIGHIDSEGVCFLLRHQVGVEVFVDQAIEWLKQDPLADMQYYPGDLLIAVLGLEPKHLIGARAMRLEEITIRALQHDRSVNFPLFEEQRRSIDAGLKRLRELLSS